ncbi:glutamate--cysteine ligase [Buchnera aphidicola]|uniref:glutamate--cysteine ligase n=1 Tax=Buchnera aphidicola TaxID=9 RepID=UPI003464A3F5
MIEDISKKIAWLKKRPIILKNIFRGIERETLRIKKNGQFSENKHPYLIGSSLTHRWITTDFSENLLEFVTPTSKNINYLLKFLQDVHSFVAYKIKNERMWPFSIPYSYNQSTPIKIAEYGQSQIGKIKNIYRKGLKNRYGDLINTISGIHYNFSLPKIFWKNWKKDTKNLNHMDYVSCGYLNLIRNYYRFGWVISYLFGASPAISRYFLKNKKHKFKKNKEKILYLPWSTSLRLSDMGYTKTSIIDLNILFNDLESYIKNLDKAIHTTSKKFSNIGMKNEKGEFLQLNTNILQMESELYTPIRPKRTTKPGESFLHALKNKGIEYVEIRSLDVNPFSPIGINKDQILILDLFLIWCALIDAPEMNKSNILLNNKNWENIIFEGRKPNQQIYINNQYETKLLTEIGEIIFQDLKKIARIMDFQSENFEYQEACKKTVLFFKNTELTYSAQLLKIIIKDGAKKTGLDLANKYHNQFIKKFHKNSHKNILECETIRSHSEQSKIENSEILSKKFLPC